jgi:hypothetical protein
LADNINDEKSINIAKAIMAKTIISEDWFFNRFDKNEGKPMFEFEIALFTNIGSPKKNTKNKTKLAIFAFVYPSLNISGK